MIGNINYRILDSLVAEMVHRKSEQIQEETALSYEKVVHDIVCECENMAKSWNPENLYEDIQILDYNVPEDKFDIEPFLGYICTSSEDPHEHYRHMLEQSSMDELEKELVLNDYAKKTGRNQNETLPPHYHLIEYFNIKLKDTLDRLEETIYDRPPEFYQAYYASIVKAHERKVREEITSLKKLLCRKCRTTTVNDYKELTEGVKSALSEIDPKIPLDCFLLKGSDDTAAFGQYLICVRKEFSKDNLIKVIQKLAALQWLLQKQEALQRTPKKDGTSDNLLENAIQDVLHNHLGMKDNSSKVTFEQQTFRRDNVIIAFMHYLIDQKVIKQISLSNFISLIAPFMDITDKKNVENIQRTCRNENKELLSYGCNLKDLSWQHIKDQYSCAPEKEINKQFDKWDGLYAAIDTATQKSTLFKDLIAKKKNQPTT